MFIFLGAQIVLPIVVVGILFVFVTIYKWAQRNKKRRSPFTDSALLRLPGHSLNEKIEELSANIDQYIFAIFSSAMLFLYLIMFEAERKGITLSFSNFWIYYSALIMGVCFFSLQNC